MTMLKNAVNQKQFRCNGVVAFYRAHSVGDDIEVLDENGTVIETLYGIRQQVRDVVSLLQCEGGVLLVKEIPTLALVKQYSNIETADVSLIQVVFIHTCTPGEDKRIIIYPDLPVCNKDWHNTVFPPKCWVLWWSNESFHKKITHKLLHKHAQVGVIHVQ